MSFYNVVLLKNVRTSSDKHDVVIVTEYVWGIIKIIITCIYGLEVDEVLGSLSTSLGN